MNPDYMMTDVQRALVEHHLSVVDWVITDYIKWNPQICGLDYSDVYQEGCFHLCRAAISYTGEPERFGAYARTVVRNGLISYCRVLCRREAALPLRDEVLDENGNAAYQRSTQTMEQEVLDNLSAETVLAAMREFHDKSSGVVKLGLEALELKTKGLSGQEIADLYGVHPNHVSAWISRAVQRLRRSTAFRRACPF